nr:uncharacterized protein LOC125420794 [Ziziphus jujuba var. spinosa]
MFQKSVFSYPSNSSVVFQESVSDVPSAKHDVENLMLSMEDKELLRRASMVPMVAEHPNKVVFMLLTKGPITLGPLWEIFLKGHEGLYSIYVHSHPSYNDSNTPQNSVFHGRRIPIKVWAYEAIPSISTKGFANMDNPCMPQILGWKTTKHPTFL